MLKIQEYLQTKSLAWLEKDYAIRATKHDDGRVILNYDQIDSHKYKFEKIVRECRGLVLDQNNDWTLVARSFERFFNLGEYRKEQDKFLWERSYSTEKVDGSLILIYYWQGQWRIQTRGSFGEGLVGLSGLTWIDLVSSVLPEKWQSELDPELTYVGELCSRWNKVVRDYPTPTFYLLTVFNGEYELLHEQSEYIAKQLKLKFPETYSFGDAFEVQGFLGKQAEQDGTFEGVVLRDCNNRRLKAKSELYVQLHHMINNHCLTLSRLLEVFCKNEQSELICYFPELTSRFLEIEEKVATFSNEIDSIWNNCRDIKSQKDFALAVKDSKYSHILFQARRNGNCPKNYLENPKILEKLLKSLS